MVVAQRLCTAVWHWRDVARTQKLCLASSRLVLCAIHLDYQSAAPPLGAQVRRALWALASSSGSLLQPQLLSADAIFHPPCVLRQRHLALAQYGVRHTAGSLGFAVNAGRCLRSASLGQVELGGAVFCLQPVCLRQYDAAGAMGHLQPRRFLHRRRGFLSGVCHLLLSVVAFASLEGPRRDHCGWCAADLFRVCWSSV